MVNIVVSFFFSLVERELAAQAHARSSEKQKASTPRADADDQRPSATIHHQAAATNNIAGRIPSSS